MHFISPLSLFSLPLEDLRKPPVFFDSFKHLGSRKSWGKTLKLILTFFFLSVHLAFPLKILKAQESSPQLALVPSSTLPHALDLEITLPKGWKIYAPLKALPDTESSNAFGQAPEVTWEGSQNLKSLEITWPPGEWEGTAPYGTYVYKRSLRVPMVLKPLELGKPLLLKVKISYFACATLCHPFEKVFQVDFSPFGFSVGSSGTPPKRHHKASFKASSKDSASESFSDPDPSGMRAQEQKSLLSMIFMALLGGFILNFMPCVLPVLSLKILGILRSHHPHFRKKFLLTGLGIVVSFLLLGGALVCLRILGVSMGWGFHFQNPVFLGFMVLITLGFSLNLYGLFHIPLPSGLATRLSRHIKGGTGDFLSGMFATLLATPCSAPFLGTSLSFALSQGPREIFVLFTALGVGFALPYGGAVMIPERFIHFPKPGKWMGYVQKCLATALLCTSLWLGSLLALHPSLKLVNSAFNVETLEGQPWLTFQEETVHRLVQKGHIVFVDITAPWCVTCHMNKKVAFQNKAVLKKFKEAGVILMRGDWSQPNEAIRSYLERHHRHGIPFNSFYGPKIPHGLVLPEILSPQQLLKALEAMREPPQG